MDIDGSPLLTACRQAGEYLLRVRSCGVASEEQLLQCIHDIATASRNYVKNQLTWFRDADLFKWVDAGAPQEAVLAAVLAELGKERHEGGCGDSGRLSKEERMALKRYKAQLKLFSDKDRVADVLDWVKVNIITGQAATPLH